MKVKLMVDWERKEILTVKELDERINAKVEEAMQDADVYDEYLDDYLDCHYTKRSLFDVLMSSDAERIEELAAIRKDIAEEIYDCVNMNMSSDYEEVVIDI